MRKRDTKESSVILRFRMKPEREELVKNIAKAETDGNVSDLLRRLAEQKIAKEFPSHALPEFAA